MTLKKSISLLVALAQFLLLAPAVDASQPMEKRMLMVSAYYSPLPNQSFYMRGSYEADIRLNGRGTNGADGTQVYTGMLAAPRTYPFGTRIRIPGLGVGEVHDRGGAIKARASYDRIDVWMGYGEEGLSRALNWGMRLVEGEVYFTPHQVEPGLSFGWVSSTLPQSTLSRLQAKTMINPQAFTQPITRSSSQASIRELQEALRLFGYYHGAVDGVYTDETRDAVLLFQIDEGVIPSKSALGAGYFGPKTQQALKTKSENFNSRILIEQQRLKDNLKALSVGLGKNAEGDEVYRVQQMLWELGYYRGDLNGQYNAVTIDAVFRFQKDNGIVQNDWDTGAGYFGKQTHQALAAAVDRRIEKLKKYPVEMQVWVPAKVDLPTLNQLSAPANPFDRTLSFDVEFKTVDSSPLFNQDLSLNDRGTEVARLQNLLIKEGYLAEGLDTGYFGAQTQNALVRFQTEKGIIQNAGSAGAGVAGPKTRETLNILDK
ncbi:peptidoglycan-binding protein [Candidatus Peregrinibacteria bacterium]|nr:peptidoglycan-binding protein [Candidatus Peregrinibacteria bacterium]